MKRTAIVTVIGLVAAVAADIQCRPFGSDVSAAVRSNGVDCIASKNRRRSRRRRTSP
jgi:hypothetical protein